MQLHVLLTKLVEMQEIIVTKLLKSLSKGCNPVNIGTLFYHEIQP